MKAPLFVVSVLAGAMSLGTALAAPPSENTIFSSTEGVPLWACKDLEGMQRLVESLKNDPDQVIATATKAGCGIAGFKGVIVGKSVDFDIIKNNFGRDEHLWGFWVQTITGSLLVMHEEVMYDPSDKTLGDPT